MRGEWEEAVLRGSIDELQCLLLSGTNIDARNGKGQTSLMLAAAEGHAHVVEWLAERGAALDDTAKYGLSALMLAVVRGHVDVVRKLTDAGASVSLRGTGSPGFFEKTALDLAVARGDPEMVEILRSGAQTDQVLYTLRNQDRNRLLVTGMPAMQRRHFLSLPLLAACGALGRRVHAGETGRRTGAAMPDNDIRRSRSVKLFLCGDVMTGRGIDQILPYPSAAEIHEPYMTSAVHYVDIAERASGRIPRAVAYAYVWGDVLQVLQDAAPDARIINLETAVTTSDDYWPGKGINYRMHPANTPCLTAAGIDCCVLANNHVIDWGYEGLRETLQSLRAAGIRTAGAGRDIAEARAPAVIDVDGQRRVSVFSMGSTSSGIGRGWAAGRRNPGVWLLPDLSTASVESITTQVSAAKLRGDIVIASIHWGGNWGYAIPAEQRYFAHTLIDQAGVDLVHGHSSHHPRGIEVYRNKLILYGCGDFLNDYEGISSHEEFRGDLTLMYLPELDAHGRLLGMDMWPMQIHRFRLRQASAEDSRWLARVLDRESWKLGSRVVFEDDRLKLRSFSRGRANRSDSGSAAFKYS